MNKFFNAEEMLEAGKTAVSKQVNQQAKAISQSVSSQITGSGTNESANSQNTQQATPQDAASQQANEDFIKELYGTSDPVKSQIPNAQNQQTTNSPTSPMTLQGNTIDQPKTTEEAERLASARKGLMEQHMATYYRPTFEPVGKKEEDTAERLEREDQEKEAKKMQELQEEQKKNEVPLAIRMGSNKAEKYPGASG